MAEEANTNGTQQISDSSTTPEPAGALSGGGDPKSNAAATEPKTVSNNEPAKSENTPSAEELAEFRKWQESQKSDAEKQAATIGKSRKKQNKPLKKKSSSCRTEIYCNVKRRFR